MLSIRDFIVNFYSAIPIYNNKKPQGSIDLNQSILPFINDPSYNFASEYFMKHPELVIEALTSPTANRPTDYERLEFYGDSVISFLVILELFLCGDKTWSEGDLDKERIQRVSNMNFTKINQ